MTAAYMCALIQKDVFPPLLYICVPNCQCNYITRPLGLGFEQNVIFQFVLAPLCVCVCVCFRTHRRLRDSLSSTVGVGLPCAVLRY